MKLYQKFVHYYMEDESGKAIAIPGFENNLVTEDEESRLLLAIIDKFKKEGEGKLDCRHRLRLRAEFKYYEVSMNISSAEIAKKVKDTLFRLDSLKRETDIFEKEELCDIDEFEK